MHKTLEIIWNNLENHTALSALQENELHALIDASIDSTLQVSIHTHSIRPLYLALEKRRLHQLIWDWLQLEKERQPFRVINNEKNLKITLGQLTLQMRIDRIDELADGKKLIIDYKTGKHNEIHAWFTERPEDPQLPLYALVDSDHICGITFAQIYPGEHGFKGVSQYALDIKGIKMMNEIKCSMAASWHDQLAQWRRVMDQLSDHFFHGIAKVAPKDPIQTCMWCALSPLCRIKET